MRMFYSLKHTDVSPKKIPTTNPEKIDIIAIYHHTMPFFRVGSTGFFFNDLQWAPGEFVCVDDISKYGDPMFHSFPSKAVITFVQD